MPALDPRKVQYIVVHCSASPPEMHVDASVIDRWHRNRGFLKIGYHSVINRDGGRQKGRSLDEIGAHVQGFNAVSIGVCLVGGVNKHNKAENNFTAEQFASLNDLLHALKLNYPAAHIQGHRDFPGVAKDCPSFDVREWLKSVAPELL